LADVSLLPDVRSRQQRPFHIAHYTKSIALFGATHKAVEIMEDRGLA
jgi:hypothetical protein